MKKQLAFLGFLCSMALGFAGCSGDKGNGNSGGGDTTKNCAVCVPDKPDTSAFSKQLNSLNHFVPVDSALVWVRNFRRQYQSIIRGKFGSDTALLPLTETFNLKIIDSIIVQPTTVGFRVYLGLKSDNEVHLIFVGVDYNGIDAIQEAEGAQRAQRFQGSGSGSKAIAGESGQRNPPGGTK